MKKTTAVLSLPSPWEDRIMLCWCRDLPEHKGEPWFKKTRG